MRITKIILILLFTFPLMINGQDLESVTRMKDTAEFTKTPPDTIFSIWSSPSDVDEQEGKVDSVASIVIAKYNVVFKRGTLKKVERNFNTMKKLKKKYGDNFSDTLFAELSYSQAWTRYLRGMTKMAPKFDVRIFLTKYSGEYQEFAILKKCKVESLSLGVAVPNLDPTLVQKKDATKIYLNIEWDKNGRRIVDQEKVKEIKLKKRWRRSECWWRGSI